MLNKPTASSGHSSTKDIPPEWKRYVVRRTSAILHTLTIPPLSTPLKYHLEPSLKSDRARLPAETSASGHTVDTSEGVIKLRFLGANKFASALRVGAILRGCF